MPSFEKEEYVEYMKADISGSAVWSFISFKLSTMSQTVLEEFSARPEDCTIAVPVNTL